VLDGQPVRLHRLDLVLARERARITISGEVDLLAAASLERVLASLQSLPALVLVDLSDCTFLDTTGIAPLVEAARDRHERGWPEVRIEARSAAVERLLQTSGLGGDPLLDLAAWDALSGARPA
jgi:anti-anti-sigma factor